MKTSTVHVLTIHCMQFSTEEYHRLCTFFADLVRLQPVYRFAHPIYKCTKLNRDNFNHPLLTYITFVWQRQREELVLAHVFEKEIRSVTYRRGKEKSILLHPITISSKKFFFTERRRSVVGDVYKGSSVPLSFQVNLLSYSQSICTKIIARCGER